MLRVGNLSVCVHHDGERTRPSFHLSAPPLERQNPERTFPRLSKKIFLGYCPVGLDTEFSKNALLLSWTNCHYSGSKRMSGNHNSTLFPSLPRVTHSGHIRVIFCVLPVHHSFSVGSINKNPVGTSQGQDVHQDFSGQI